MRFLRRLLLTGCLLSCFGCLGSIVFSQVFFTWLKNLLIEPTPLLLDPVRAPKNLALLNKQMISGEMMQLSAEELESIIWEHKTAHLVALDIEFVDGEVVVAGSTKAENPNGFFNFKLSFTPRNTLDGNVELRPKHCTLGKANLYFLCQALSNKALAYDANSLFNELSVQNQRLSVSFNPTQLEQLLSIVAHSDLTIQNPE